MGTVNEYVKFQAVLTKYREVNATSCVLAKHINGRGQAVWPRTSAKLTPYVQTGTVNKHVKFQVDLTTYSQVIATSCVMAKHGPSPRRQGNAISRDDLIFMI